jgi:ataxia telangiectasia mutated family protein
VFLLTFFAVFSASQFKSGDDIRQDFLMEQLFGVVNVLLQRDGRTRARALRYRTYNVVPLAQMSGTIEFVSNTCSYQEWVRPAQFK